MRNCKVFIRIGAILLIGGLCGCMTTSSESSQVSSERIGGDVTTGYQPIQSELIYSVSYDVDDEVLTVVLYEGGVYDYAAVPKTVYEGLLNAADHDDFYSAQVKPNYKGTKFSME